MFKRLRCMKFDMYYLKMFYLGIIHDIKYRKFLKDNTDYVSVFSYEAQERIDEYIRNTNVRLKIISALLIKVYSLDSDIELLKELNFDIDDIQYTVPISKQIKIDLKLI